MISSGSFAHSKAIIFTSKSLFFSISIDKSVALSQALSLSKQRYIFFVSLFIIQMCFSVNAVQLTQTTFLYQAW
jgi:hypothetical protein